MDFGEVAELEKSGLTDNINVLQFISGIPTFSYKSPPLIEYHALVSTIDRLEF